MLEEEAWDSDSGMCSGHCAYDFNYDSDGDNTVASTMLPIFASGGKKKPKKKQGKGKSMPAPTTVMSSGVSQTPIRDSTMILPEKIPVYAGDDDFEMPQGVAEKIVGTAVIKVMKGHFKKLYSKIDNVKTELSTLKTTVASLVEENKKLRKVRGNAPDSEKQPPSTPETPKKDLTIRPRPHFEPRKRVGTPLAREVLARNWEKQVDRDNATSMNIDESDPEPGRLGKSPRSTSPPPMLMHSRYGGASATAKRREDDRGEN
jgi:hypothetical protein